MIFDDFKTKAIFLQLRSNNQSLRHITIVESSNDKNKFHLGGIVEGADGMYHKFFHKQANLTDFNAFEEKISFVYQISSQVEFTPDEIDYLYNINHCSYTTDSDADYMFRCV